MYKTKIPSDINNICPAIGEILCYLGNAYGAVQDDIAFEVKVILNELILNAIRHGNKEDCNKYVKIEASITKKNNLLLIIEDEGQGYDHSQLFNKESYSITDIDLCDLKVSGRGLLIVTNLCDKVRFNKKGNRIIVLKKLSS